MGCANCKHYSKKTMYEGFCNKKMAMVNYDDRCTEEMETKLMKRTAEGWMESDLFPKNVIGLSRTINGAIRMEYKDGTMIDYSKNEIVEG